MAGDPARCAAPGDPADAGGTDGRNGKSSPVDPAPAVETPNTSCASGGRPETSTAREPVRRAAPGDPVNVGGPAGRDRG